MKSFLGFLAEVSKSQAALQAERMQLTNDGHGNWYDKKGNLVARTVAGRLEMLTKKQAKEIQEPESQQQPQQQQEPEVTTAAAEKEDEADLEAQEKGQFGTFSDGTPRRMAPPTTADGSPKEDLGPLTVTFGRFNPPTIGHQKLLDAAQKAAGKGALKIYPSRSQDAKKNPYDPDEKVDVMKQMFPDHAGSIVNDPNAKTIFDVLKQAHQDGYSSVKIVVGGDRVKEFEKLSGDYNGKLYDFSDVATVSAGERDPDSEGVEGMSASKMRKAAADGDLAEFRKGLPDNIDDKTAKRMMSTIRKKMNVSEGWNLWEIAPKFDWKNLRENYVTGKIFKVDQLVENLNTGLVGKVIRRGTNYLICVTEDNIMFKSWIRDLCEYTEVKMDRKKRTPKKPNTLVGTGGYFKYVADMTPGFEKGDKTNIQPGGKPYKGPARNIKEFINKYKKKSI
jgi:hypothetical protein